MWNAMAKPAGVAAFAALCLLAGSPVDGAIVEAGDLLVDLDAAADSAGDYEWENAGLLGSFSKVGDPVLEVIDGVSAVRFRGLSLGAEPDAYRCVENAPAGIVGLDATRSIEVWAYNDDIADEETLVAWGRRGGPDGTNMSFNYGRYAIWGAVGHWGWPDIGWNDGGGAPPAGVWHHLAYTFDGTTTRVYADGVLMNTEVLGAGVINTHPGFPIVIGAQTLDTGVGLDAGQAGTLAIARVRVHDDVLSDDDVLNNYTAEKDTYQVEKPPVFVEAPSQGAFVVGDPVYSAVVVLSGYPVSSPHALQVLEPVGATVTDLTGLSVAATFSYTIPDPPPSSFAVVLQATNGAGSAQASWTVTRRVLPADDIAVAEELLVSLDAADGSAGEDEWTNDGSLANFVKIGFPYVTEIEGVPAVVFNEMGPTDAYECLENAPAGIVGPSPTRSIEVWAFNEMISDEETLVAWGRRGGGDGTNMSFNYGFNGSFGAVGHWGAGPDLGWNDAGGAPAPAQWHHLVYTFDGATTRVYADGELSNSETLLPGAINTHAGTPITLAAQRLNTGAIDWNLNLVGSLALARVRVHDGVLSPSEILHNYNLERAQFGIADEAPEFVNPPDRDFFYAWDTVYARRVTATGIPYPTFAVLEPEGATIDRAGDFLYTLPDPAPAQFTVTLSASNGAGSVQASWVVTRVAPVAPAQDPVHRYSFSGNADDAIGGAHGTVYGNVVFGEGQAFLSNDGSQFSNMADPFPDPFDPEKTPPGAYIELPNGIISALGARATFEAWVTCNGPTSSVWQRIFDFGISDGGENASSGAPNSYYIFLTPRSGTNTLRFGYNSPVPVRIERMLDGIAIDTFDETHVAVVWNDDTTTAELYVNGVRVGMDVLKHFSLADIPDVNNWLGRAQWPDAMFNGSYNEFRIYDYALNPAEVMGSYECGPDCGGQVIDTVAVRTGDVNGDGALNIADAIAVLQFLFGEPKPAIPCMKAADANDDDALNIADAITVLSYLFAGQEMKNPDGTILAAGAASNCVAYDKVHIPETLAGQPGCATPCVPQRGARAFGAASIGLVGGWNPPGEEGGTGMRTRGAWAAVVLAAFWFCGAWCAAQIEVAGELFVELDARDASAGQATWVNTGSLGDFVRFGAPAAETVGGVSAVTFNKVAADQDAYQCAEVAPAGIVGPDPTFSVEVWAYNPQVADEETLVAWGRRGGPDGSNMSFNYGAHGVFGAVGHWGAPDLGWRAGGGAPVAGQWHHLAYTYDGAVQRVYADGELWNERTLTSPKLNIHSGTKITIAAQILAIGDPADPNFGLPDFGGHKGALSIARVRVHDGVLSGGQVLGNYVAEVGDFPAPPEFVEYPASDVAFAGSDLPYTAKVVVIGIPAPSLEVLEPSGATISEDGVLSYTLPDPAPVSFVVGVRASNDGGDATASWTVTVSTLPPLGSLVVGGELFVELDAADETAGSSAWANTGTLDDFTVIGEPAVVEIAGARGVEFNRTALPAFDGYIQSEPGGAPAGLIGLDPTFTVEAWVFNRQIPDEETIVSWGKRGGPCGSNMSFNYGTNAAYGAVGHWCGQDIGWGTVPAAGQWRHLAYSYDGAVQRVFADGVETNTKYLGPNQINVWGADGARPNPKILLMAQNVNVGDNDVGPGDLGLRGVMTLGRLRIHDEALVLAEVRHNYLGERPEFPFIPPSFADVPSDDLVLTGAASYARAVSVRSAGTPSVEVLEPAGAEIVLSAPGVYTLSYTLPDPEPEAFTVALRATDEYGAGEAAWVVTVVRPADLAMAPVHRYSFAADASDSIGGAHGVLVNQSGAAAYADGQVVLGNDGSQSSTGVNGDYIDLPNGIISVLGTQATFEAWVTWNGPDWMSWQRIFDFGTSDAGEGFSSGGANAYYIFLTPRSGAGTLRCGYNDPGPPRVERWCETAVLAVGVEQHVAVVWNDDTTTADLYLNGARVARDQNKHFALADLVDNNNWLGRAQWPDALFVGSYNEFRIYGHALTPAEVLGSFTQGPDTLAVVSQGRYVYTGDANGDGAVDIADAIKILGYLFAGDTDVKCLANLDTNNDRAVDIADAISVLSYLFAGGSMTAPDGTPISAGAHGCALYEEQEGQLPCDVPCTP